jgi:Skp family chaperone for outer membrane proteins
MNIRIVDFDILTRNFLPYIDGFNRIEDEKKKLIDSIESEKEELKTIISSSTSGIIIDDRTQRQNMERVKELQQILLQKDQEFKTTLKTMRDDLNSSVFSQLQEIIEEWSVNNSIDCVMGKIEVIYLNDKYDITEQIIEVFKKRDLYFDYESSLNEKESV